MRRGLPPPPPAHKATCTATWSKHGCTLGSDSCDDATASLSLSLCVQPCLNVLPTCAGLRKKTRRAAGKRSGRNILACRRHSKYHRSIAPAVAQPFKAVAAAAAKAAYRLTAAFTRRRRAPTSVTEDCRRWQVLSRPPSDVLARSQGRNGCRAIRHMHLFHACAPLFLKSERDGLILDWVSIVAMPSDIRLLTISFLRWLLPSTGKRNECSLTAQLILSASFQETNCELHAPLYGTAAAVPVPYPRAERLMTISAATLNARTVVAAVVAAVLAA
eukprot:3878195-Pleurochrysis_carterae.AAC.1